MTRLSDFVTSVPRRIAAIALLIGLGSALMAAPAVTGLPAGGFDVPDAESIRADRVLEERFGAGGMSIVFTVTSEAGSDSPAARARGQQIVSTLVDSPHARQVASYWTTPKHLAESLISSDGRTGLVVARITGGDKEAPRHALELVDRIPKSGDGVSVAASGPAMVYSDVESQSRIDLVTFELIALPITFLALVWFFGSAIAALLPLAIALFATAGTVAALWQISKFTDVSVFATNLASAVCLALAVDYTLFILNRYREEIAHGHTVRDALRISMNTAGRTICYSALTMALTLATLAIFPQYLFRSLAYAGVLSVLLSLAGALILAPTLIVLLGDRIDALNLRELSRARRAGKPVRVKSDTESFWYRTANFAVRRPVTVLLACVAILVPIGLPFLGIVMAYPDDRELPASTSSREAGDILRANFTQNFAGTMQIVISSGIGSPAQVTAYARELSAVDGILQVSGPNGLYRDTQVVSAATYDSALKGNTSYLTITTDRDPFSDSGKALLDDLKAVPAPGPTMFAGMAQRNLDNIDAVTDRTPLVLAIIAAVTLIFTFLMTGSFLVPIKVLVTNAISIMSACGVVVWIFQEGNLGGFGTETTGRTVVLIPLMLICVAYALSMDYAVFVLSRVQEEWNNSAKTREDNNRAVAIGISRTGRIVTAAAVIMIIVFVGISVGQVAFMRGLGVGLVVSVLVDAFLVRVLLVPATMGLLGRANWWAPAFIARWHARSGLGEGSPTGLYTAAPSAQPRVQISVSDEEDSRV
ncbi:MMPL family transporter [Nocardia fluminea]|uniref:MMPL family transporter n=1 Tax=Nocardia fluminea TaxID=134984 RepID=UPI0036727A8E